MQNQKGASGNKRRNNRQSPNGRPPTEGQAFFEKTENIQRPVSYDRQVVRMMKLVNYTNNFVTSSATNTFASYAFSFADLFDNSELGAVFDQYKIERIDWKFTPNITESLSSTPVTGSIFTCFDFDDANVFTSISDPYDYSNVVVWRPTDVLQGTFVPHFAYAAFATGVFSSFANSPPRWIDCASAAVQHYGLKLAATTTGTAVSYAVSFRYHVALRMTH